MKLRRHDSDFLTFVKMLQKLCSYRYGPHNKYKNLFHLFLVIHFKDQF